MPCVYDASGISRPRNLDWVVRNMDYEIVFGVELYRRVYMEVLARGWLVYYRIINRGFNDRQRCRQCADTYYDS